MVTYLSDDFNRANSTSSPGTPATGGPYTVAAGTWGINSNALYTSASLATAVLTYPSGRDVDITVKFLSASDASGIVFRYVDLNNFWTLYQPASANARWTLARRVAGTLVSVWDGPIMAAGDTARVVAYGPTIYVFINGKFYGSIADNWATVPATSAPSGFYVSSSTVAHFDSVTAVDAIAAPSGSSDGGTAGVLTDQRIPAAPQTGAYIYKGRDTAALDTIGVA